MFETIFHNINTLAKTVNAISENFKQKNYNIFNWKIEIFT